MEIKTKFSVGDTVFGISSEHRIVKFVVGRIIVSCSNEVEEGYYPKDGNEYRYFNASYCFPSMEDAILYVKGGA
ncbi:hypothetical protein [Prevotella koreensis]